jgi:glycosyltransferase involved in cell wall biosynthesis
MAADGDGRPRDGLDDLDFLFAEFEAARRSEPRLSLWLVGRPSAAVGAYAAGKPWIRLFGYVPFDRVLDHVACFDVAVYPRTYSLPPGRFSVKVAQYLALGVPVVSTPVEESFAVRESGGGVVAGAGEFREALAALGALPGRRSELGAAGRRFASERLEWSHLVRRYREILE